MSNPNHNSQPAGQAAADTSRPAHELEPFASDLVELRPSLSRQFEQKVFYELGYQAGCQVAGKTTAGYSASKASVKFYAATAACVCLAMAGGFLAGRWQAKTSPEQSTVAVAQAPPKSASQVARPDQAPSASEPAAQPRNPGASELGQLPSWWPWLVSLHPARQPARLGLRIGPIGADWENMVVSATSSNRLSAAPEASVSQPLDPEMRRIMQLASPLAPPARTERFRKLLHPLL